MSIKIGSLFDGSGGFPLAGAMCGFEPTYASEVEPYPIAVTRSRFPTMKHFGDVSKINGAEVEPVDIITFGSPCQDMSVAGKRAGLKHEANGDEETTRSGLFMEAVRIIKEMRGATNGEYPRFAVWENVPGAFSSNKGEDFRIVLEELIKVTEPYAVMPEVPKKGWAYADCFSGDGWSIAYRVFDAQFWGVPQRRRRIYLVADFRGQCAGKILFEREGLRGYSAESGTPRKRTSSDTESCVGADDCLGADQYNAVVLGDTVSTLGVNCGMSHGRQCVLEPMARCFGIGSYDSNGMKSDNPHSGIYEAETARTLDPNGGNPACHQGGIAIVEPKTYGFPLGFRPENVRCYEETATTLCNGTRAGFCNGVVVGIDGYNADETGDKAATLGVNCGMSSGRNGVITDTHILDDQGGAVINVRKDGKSPTLRAQMGGHPPVVMVEGFDAYNQTLTCVEFFDEITRKYIVRRLTPTECARLQGFPDRWGNIDPKSDFTDEEYRFWLDVRNTHAEINDKAVKDYTKKQMLTWYNKLHTDSAEYKMWGNGIALPCALYVMEGIADVMKGEN